MTAQILDGKSIALLEQQRLAQQVAGHLKQGHRAPGLAVILVGKDPASQVYVQKKRQTCQAVGFHSVAIDLPTDVSQEALMAQINTLNQDPTIDGILIQLPLPAHLIADQVLEQIVPHKDVDGFHAYNIGKLVQNQPGLRPCTPHGVMTLLEHTPLKLEGCRAVVVGASQIVGRPMALELLNRNATVTVCHRHTLNVPEYTQEADLLIVAIGQPNHIKGHWIKKGAVVIDVGITRLPNGKLCGDVDFKEAKEKASWITPVPGGVGPMTVISLLKNTFIATQKHLGVRPGNSDN